MQGFEPRPQFGNEGLKVQSFRDFEVLGRILNLLSPEASSPQQHLTLPRGGQVPQEAATSEDPPAPAGVFRWHAECQSPCFSILASPSGLARFRGRRLGCCRTPRIRCIEHRTMGCSHCSALPPQDGAQQRAVHEDLVAGRVVNVIGVRRWCGDLGCNKVQYSVIYYNVA